MPTVEDLFNALRIIASRMKETRINEDDFSVGGEAGGSAVVFTFNPKKHVGTHGDISASLLAQIERASSPDQGWTMSVNEADNTTTFTLPSPTAKEE